MSEVASMTLTLDAEQHRYYVNGETVPSVTQLVAPLGADFDEPENDRAELMLEAAAERGTTMHEYIEHRLRGGECEDFELPSQYQDYAEAVELFLAEHTIEPFAIETALALPCYAGTPDLTCEFDGKNAILDWKFVSQIAKSRVMAQLGGYMELCEQNGFSTDALYAVQFLKDATYRLYAVDMDAAREAIRVCRELYRIKTRKHPRGRIG